MPADDSDVVEAHDGHEREEDRAGGVEVAGREAADAVVEGVDDRRQREEAEGDEYRQLRDVLDDYNHRQEFEHTLIDRKTTWLLTAQTILFAAYGVTFSSEGTISGREVFRIVVAGAGAFVAALGYYGVRRLIESKETSWNDYRPFFTESRRRKLSGPLERRELDWGVRTKNTRRALYPDKFLPLVFIIAWSVLVISELVT